MRISSFRAIGSLLLAALAAGLAQPAAAQSTITDTPSALSPPGANDWSCKPSAAHPRPVVLVHGVWSDMLVSWLPLSPLLVGKGYCVFALNYGAGTSGVNGTAPMEQSAQELANFVGEVLAATKATQVDIVGHSEGALMPRWYLKYLNGATQVHSLIGLAPPNHGTDVDGLITLGESLPVVGKLVQQGFASWCPACIEFITGSLGDSFLATLNGGGDTVPGVQYTVIMSDVDLVVTPYTSGFLSGPGVTNITLQKQCILDPSNHVTEPYDFIALHDVLNALDPDHATPVGCFG